MEAKPQGHLCLLIAVIFVTGSTHAVDLSGIQLRNLEDRISAVFHKVANKDPDGTEEAVIRPPGPPPRPRTTTTSTTSTTTTTTTTTPRPTTTTPPTTPRPTRMPFFRPPPPGISDIFVQPTTTRRPSTTVAPNRRRDSLRDSLHFDDEQRHFLGIPREEVLPDLGREKYDIQPVTPSIDDLPEAIGPNSVFLNYNAVDESHQPTATDSAAEDHSADPIVREPVKHVVNIKKSLGIYWDVHVYLFGILYLVLAVCTVFCMVRLNSLTKSNTKFSAFVLLVVVLLWSLIKSVDILYDAYNVHSRLPPILSSVLSFIGLPILSSALVIMFFSLLQATRIRLLHPCVQNPVTVAGVITLHCLLAIVSAVVVASSVEGSAMFLVCNLVYLIWSMGLALGFVFVFKKLYLAAQRIEGEFTQELFAQCHFEGQILPKSFSKSTLSRAVKFTMVASFVKICIATVIIFGVIFLFGAFNNLLPLPWPWWTYQIILRSLELLFSALIAYIAAQPLRKFCMSRGKNLFDTPSKCSVFCMSPCANSTLQSDPKSLDYASNGNASLPVAKEDLYPSMYCTKNRSLISAGSRMYHEHPYHEGVLHPSVQCFSITRHHKSCTMVAQNARRSVTNSILSDSQHAPVAPYAMNTCQGVCPRPSSMLFSENGVVRFRTVEDTPQCMDEVLRQAIITQQQQQQQQQNNPELPSASPPQSPQYWAPGEGPQQPNCPSVYQDPIDLHPPPMTPRSIASSHIYNQLLTRSDSHRSTQPSPSPYHYCYHAASPPVPAQAHSPQCRFATLGSTVGDQTLEAVHASRKAQKAAEKALQKQESNSRYAFQPPHAADAARIRSRYGSTCSSESAGNSFDVHLYQERRAPSWRRKHRKAPQEEPDHQDVASDASISKYPPAFAEFLRQRGLQGSPDVTPDSAVVADLSSEASDRNSQGSCEEDREGRSLAISFSEFLKNTRSLNDLFKNSSKPPAPVTGGPTNLASSSNNGSQSIFERLRSGSNFSLNSSQNQNYLYSPLDCEDGASCTSSLRRSRSESRMDAGSPDWEDPASKPLLAVNAAPAPRPPPSAADPPSTAPVVRRVVRRPCLDTRLDGSTQTNEEGDIFTDRSTRGSVGSSGSSIDNDLQTSSVFGTEGLAT
ncbi:unnamed protein product [Cyprideis torosa]|uniref:Proline-rich transmembrane protein 3/4 domain-containing protein n=1 Tax=Cyprideis torosa TaxID=163714 RepID=A0A7R8WA20_9CRUS|nr:unnamed protein product [Cyprideis torosa]CAG0885011.1 unnamed protein product [Cyprideis torosa]